MSEAAPVKEIRIGRVAAGGNRPVMFIAGPCVIESEDHCLMMARRLADIFSTLSLEDRWIFKSSYDKANRTSVQSFRGPGIERGLEILAKVRDVTGAPVLTDVHSIEEVEPAAQVADVLQIPAFLCRQTDLILEAARIARAVNIKKGQFMAPWDMRQTAEKCRSAGAENVLLTERGVSFGYNNLVSDMRSLPVMRSFGYPVIFDATHSVQLPGGAGERSGGERRFVDPLARAAVAAGCDGVFMEVHQDPDHAPSDGPNMVVLDKLETLLRRLIRIDEVVRNFAV